MNEHEGKEKTELHRRLNDDENNLRWKLMKVNDVIELLNDLKTWPVFVLWQCAIKERYGIEQLSC